MKHSVGSGSAQGGTGQEPTGGTLHAVDSGAHEPTLIFVHGFGCALDDWDEQVALLSKHFRCIALDLPGHGGSDPPQSVTLAALGDAVNTVRRRSRAGQVILVGHSLGCKVIREAYARSSAGVAGLIMIEGAFYDGDRDILIGRAEAAIDRGGFHAYTHRHFADMFLDGSDPARRERILARVLRMDPAFGRALYLEAVGWDPRRGEETLRQIAVPLLVLQSTDLDSTFERKPLRPGMVTPFMEKVTRLVPGSEAVVVADAGHFPMMDASVAVTEAIRTFATRVRDTCINPARAGTGR